MNKTLLWVGLSSALAMAAGCQKGEGKGCFKPTDCAEGLACVGEDVMRCEKCDDLLECKKSGKCTAKDGVCIAASDEDCKKSYDCKALGPCTAKEGGCVVGSDADCKASEACEKDKYCVAKGNNCIMSEEDRKAKEKAKKEAIEAAKKKREAELALPKEDAGKKDD